MVLEMEFAQAKEHVMTKVETVFVMKDLKEELVEV